MSHNFQSLIIETTVAFKLSATLAAVVAFESSIVPLLINAHDCIPKVQRCNQIPYKGAY